MLIFGPHYTVQVLDEDRPATFAEFIKAGDYGLMESFTAHKRTLNQFRRYTGRAEGLSISFEPHLLGSKIEFDQDSSSLTIRNLPTQLTDQLKRRAPALQRLSWSSGGQALMNHIIPGIIT